MRTAATSRRLPSWNAEIGARPADRAHQEAQFEDHIVMGSIVLGVAAYDPVVRSEHKHTEVSLGEASVGALLPRLRFQFVTGGTVLLVAAIAMDGFALAMSGP